MTYRLRLALCGSLLWILAAGTASAGTFPRQIHFNVKKGITGGSFDLSFGEDLTAEKKDRYQIKLAEFEGLGFSSDQELFSMIAKKDLSLYGHIVVGADKQRIRQVLLADDCKSGMGRDTTTCFKYQDQEGDNALQTEIFTPYLAIDLVSSIVVATQEASKRTFSPTNFNFIFNKLTKQVTLAREGAESLETPLGRRDTVILSLKLKDTDFELYRFYIGRDAKGHYPVKMVFVDDNDDAMEFTAERVVW